jgi:outer membrane protein assembly factor BamB
MDTVLRYIGVSVRTIAVSFGVLLLLTADGSADVTGKQGLQVLGEFPAPGLESELAGIHPVPSDSSLYWVAANQRPAYKSGQTPLLASEHRGRLLTVELKTGKVVKSTSLVEGQYGGIAYADGHIFVSSLEPPEILKLDEISGEIVDRFPMSAAVGGLEYDTGSGNLIAQIYLGSPHIAVIDAKTGVTTSMLWSDENAMGLAKVGNHWLCTWSSGFDGHAFGELRRLDPETGKVTGRHRLEGVHFAAAPLPRQKDGSQGFMSTVALDRSSGRMSIRNYSIDDGSVSWEN